MLSALAEGLLPGEASGEGDGSGAVIVSCTNCFSFVSLLMPMTAEPPFVVSSVSRFIGGICSLPPIELS
ncbi:hypothetical protein D3C80_2189260 [compost metagenome]